MWCPPGYCDRPTALGQLGEGACYTGCGGPKRALRECYDPVAREVADEVWTGYLTPVVAPPGWVMNPDLCPAEGEGECERHSDCVIAGPEDSHFCSLEYLCEPCSGGYWDGEIWHEGCEGPFSFDGSCAPCGAIGGGGGGGGGGEEGGGSKDDNDEPGSKPITNTAAETALVTDPGNNPEDAALPPGYEDDIWCPPGYCDRPTALGQLEGGCYTGCDGPKRALRECYDPVAREVADEVWTGYLTPVVAPPGWVMNPDLCPAEGEGECERHSDCAAFPLGDSHFCSLEYLCEPCSGGYWDGEIWHEGCDNLYSFDGSCAPCGEKTEDFRTFEAEKERKQPDPKMDQNQLAFTTSSATSAASTTAIIVLCSQLMLQW